MRKNIFVRCGRFCAFAILCLLAIGLFLPDSIWAQNTKTEYRGFWVDTFNSSLNNHTDVAAVVNNAKAANANALFVQVRRRGDSWYLNSLEPKPDFVPIAAGFDPLQDLIETAHAAGVEVHAFVIMGAVWNKNPNFAPTATLGAPTDPNHVFNRHGGYDAATRTIVPGPNNWLTRTLLPDSTPGAGITFQGHRFGAEFWIDFGHEAAAAHSVNVLMHLVRNYDIDGLHLDRIRYPEIPVSGQTPTTGANIGYNHRSVERFQRRYDIPTGSAAPAPGDPLWVQWRRDQVTNVVRRVYLNAIAIRPQIKVSGALIAFGGINATNEAAWNGAEAYWRVYQDWRAWTEEGILDIAIPMNYKREQTAAQIPQFDSWNEWLKNHQYNRAGLIGTGVYLNSIEGNLRQTRRVLAASAAGNTAKGIVFYSMAVTNTAVTANPHSVPPGQNTPARPFAEFAAALTTGKSINGAVLYEDPVANPEPIFAQPANIPTFAWKTAPTKGHLMGIAKGASEAALDTASVTITNLNGNAATRPTATDGNGFYGGVDLEPGQYLVKAELKGETVYSCVADVAAGAVTTADLNVEIVAPTTTATVTSGANNANGWFGGDAVLNLTAADDCTGVAATEYSLDNGATWQAFVGNVVISTEGVTTVLYRSVDRAGNVEAAKSVTVRVDKTAPTISLSVDPARIFPPNGKPVTVTISGSGADATSGLASVSYTVTDEYGTPLSIPTRTLSGNQADWTDTLIVEASRRGNDKDGRLYRIVATVTDLAGNTSTATADVIVLHDRGKR